MTAATPEPFRIAVSEAVLEDLQARLGRTRLPDEVPGAGWEYGTERAFLQALLEYWLERYDWRAQERELNNLAQYRASVDGMRLHFIHESGANPDALPVLLLHGWPSSPFEFARVIPLLGARGGAVQGHGTAAGFPLVAPSLPGYGFSDRVARRGVNVQFMAELFCKLMTEVLGYRRFVVHGGDWGAVIASRMAEAYRSEVVGLHLSMVPVGASQTPQGTELSAEEKVFLGDLDRFRRLESGYQWIQGTKPQTLGYALNDSPAGLCAWIVEKYRTWSDCRGDIERRFTKDQLLTAVMIYWVTETINSSIRLYYEFRQRPWLPDSGPRIETPTGVAVFPAEIVRPPRAWVERIFNLRRWTVMPRGGHFAALEEPQMLADDLRAFATEIAAG